MRSRYDRLTFERDASGRVTGVRYQELDIRRRKLLFEDRMTARVQAITE